MKKAVVQAFGPNGKESKLEKQLVLAAGDDDGDSG